MVEDNLYNATFPQQKLPLSKKDDQWQHDCVNYIIGEGNIVSGGMTKTRFGELQTYYNLYNSIFDEKDFKKITNPFKVDDGFPATPQDFNIIRPKIDLLIGEETKRPMNFRVVRTSQEAASDLMDKEKQMLMQYIQATIMSRMSPEEQQKYQQQLESGEVMPPEQIAKYMDKEYKDVVENTAYHTLAYLREKLTFDNEFIKGWKDALIGGIEVYYVGILNSEPYIERVNPIYFSYDRSPDLEFIEDGSWCCRRMRLPMAEVYDRYYDKLSEKDLDKLNEMLTGVPSNWMGEKNPVDDFNHISMHIMDNPIYDYKTRYCINVWHCCWKSFKKIFYVTMQDETGQTQTTIVDETYKATGQEQSIEPDWIIETWEGYRAGNDLYFGIQPLEYQHVSIDNPNSQKLPYCGAVYSNTNSKPRSLVSILKPLQYMYIVLWYRLELAIARDKGKVVNMDITQIPKSMNITPDRWMHYLSSVGVNFINPYEEGWCFDPETGVIMADGTIKKIKDIKLADEIMTPDGKQSRVTNLFKGIDEMYNILPYIGSEKQIVTAEHIVRYVYRETWTNKVEVRYDKAKDLLLKFKQTPKYREHCYLERVDNIDTWNSKVILDPYLLGLWLGDGSTSAPEIESMDYEVISYLQDYADTHNLRTHIKPSSGSKSFTVRLSSVNNKIKGQCGKNPLIEQLRELNIYDDKDIPNQYIYTSVENRLKLLAGLIDTDGCVYKPKNNRTGYIEFTQCLGRKRIIDKFVFIARSLGFKVSVKRFKSKISKIYNNKNISYPQDFYRVRIFDGIYEIPTLISRKQIKLTSGRTYKRNLTTFDIEYCGVGNYAGFAVDDNKHEFLLDDFTIVHNCIPGREGGKPASFNQITALDLTMSQVIGEYIQLMDKVEQLAGTITGITEQREGSIGTSEMVGNVERSVIQSSHITEPLFWVHNQVKRHCLNMLLNTAKGAWEDTGKKKLSYIFDNGERAFINIPGKFYYEDMDVFVSDASKDLENIQKLQQLIQPAMQNGASLLEAAEILTSDNFNIIKQKLKDMQTRQEQQQQQQQQAESQQQQQLQQMQNDAQEKQLMLEEAKLELDRYKIDQDNLTKITTAEISAYRGSQDMDADQNGIPDPMEIAKDATQQMKVREEQYTKKYEIDQKRNIEEQKLSIEKEKMTHETQLQAAKDKAAMEREQLKAKTAIKNKVVGQK